MTGKADNVEIDPSTGLPALADNQFWRVEKRRDYGGTHKVTVIEKTEKITPRLFRSSLVEEIERELIDGDIENIYADKDGTSVWDVWNEDGSERNILPKDIPSNFRQLSVGYSRDQVMYIDYSLTKESILAAAIETLSKYKKKLERDEAARVKAAEYDKLLGDYPPKSLGDKS